MKIIPYYILFFVLVSSCNPNRNVLFVTFEDAENIRKGSPVIMSGYEIGKVERVEFDDDYDVRVKIRFDETHNIPNDSKITIGSNDIFSKAVIIEAGNRSTYFTAKDEIRGQESTTLDLENVLDWFAEKLDKPEVKSIADSIAVRLKELSDQLEEFENMDIEIKKN